MAHQSTARSTFSHQSSHPLGNIQKYQKMQDLGVPFLWQRGLLSGSCDIALEHPWTMNTWPRFLRDRAQKITIKARISGAGCHCSCVRRDDQHFTSLCCNYHSFFAFSEGEEWGRISEVLKEVDHPHHEEGKEDNCSEVPTRLLIVSWNFIRGKQKYVRKLFTNSSK